jgi:hypothetical protein
MRWHVGSQARNGDVLAEVAGEPIFLLSGRTPAYRDLQVGDSGKDVLELQTALGSAGFSVTDPEGRYGASTAAAVTAIYSVHGYSAPLSSSAVGASSKSSRTQPRSSPKQERSARLPVWSAVYATNLPATVSAVHGRVGERLTGTGALLDLASGPPIVDVSVDPSVLATLRPGMAVRLTTAEGVHVRGRVHSISSANGEALAGHPDTGSSPSQETSSSTAASQSSAAASSPPSNGSTVVVSLPLNAPGLSLGAQVNALIIRASSHHPVLVVPLSAVQTAADGSNNVEVLRHGSQVRVSVAQGLTAGGNIAVKPLPGNILQVGERVVIPN